MLFHSSLRQELARSLAATVLVLLTIVMTMMLIRTLGMASQGNVNPSEVGLVLGYTMLGHLPTLLTMSLFMSLVWTFSRMFRDSEMVIWLSSGRSLQNFLTPVIRFSWPILLLVLCLTVWVWPWSNQQIQQLKDRFEQRGDLERVSPGEFQESANGQRVFFIDKHQARDTEGQNVFVAANTPTGQTVTSAQTGRIEPLYEGRYLMLMDGQRLEIRRDDHRLRISEFKQYGSQVGSQQQVTVVTPPKTTSSWALIQMPIPDNLAELAWRLGLCLAAFNMVLIALAMARINPRAARNGHMVTAFFTFIVYYNLINLGQSWISAGRISFIGLLLLLHGGVFVLTLSILWMRDRQWSLRALLHRPASHRLPTGDAS
jgi:lipopolysaccharide export system permease protein